MYTIQYALVLKVHGKQNSSVRILFVYFNFLYSKTFVSQVPGTAVSCKIGYLLVTVLRKEQTNGKQPKVHVSPFVHVHNRFYENAIYQITYRSNVSRIINPIK